MTACPTPNKRAHGSETDAWRHANALRRAGASVDLKPYRCACGAWHVGHSVVSLMQRVRRAKRLGRA